MNISFDSEYIFIVPVDDETSNALSLSYSERVTPK
jgi:hypothetical protein